MRINKWHINLFDWDRYRYSKHIVAAKNDRVLDRSVYTCGGDSVDDEKSDILALINKLKNDGNINDYNQIALLFRSVKGREAVLDRFPTAEILKHDESGWLIKAEVYGDVVDIWLRGQGDMVEVIDVKKM